MRLHDATLYSLMMGMEFGGMVYQINDKLKGIDLKDEYALIQEKKSKLSAEKRRLVISVYERENS